MKNPRQNEPALSDRLLELRCAERKMECLGSKTERFQDSAERSLSSLSVRETTFVSRDLPIKCAFDSKPHRLLGAKTAGGGARSGPPERHIRARARGASSGRARTAGIF